jgi:ElaB/YqjD/DUF883 family membrane-anchored ribosome-binding protein
MPCSDEDSGQGKTVQRMFPFWRQLLPETRISGDVMTNGITTSFGATEGNKQALVMDLKSAVGDADRLLSNVVASTADEIALARTKLEARLTQAKTQLVDAGMAVSNRARHAADATDAYVRDNPWKMLGVAAAAGIVIGAILRSR